MPVLLLELGAPAGAIAQTTVKTVVKIGAEPLEFCPPIDAHSHDHPHDLHYHDHLAVRKKLICQGD